MSQCNSYAKYLSVLEAFIFLLLYCGLPAYSQGQSAESEGMQKGAAAGSSSSRTEESVERAGAQPGNGSPEHQNKSTLLPGKDVEVGAGPGPARKTAGSDNAQESGKAQSSATSSGKQPQSSGASAAAGKYLSIPLLYMTDRQINRRQQFLNDRKDEARSIYDVYCGKISYTLPNIEKKTLTAERKALGWSQETRRCKIRHEAINLPQQPSDSLEQFGEAVAGLAQSSADNEVFLFVHGFNSSFDAAAKCAALLAYQTERPVILYSWPSKAKLLQYFVDSGNNEWSQEHFNRLVEMLCALKEKHQMSLNVVAHSMGNRIVVRAAPILERRRLFSKAFLVDPDLDSETFLHYMARYANKQEIRVGARMCILFSHKDNALPVAQALFGGYTRLGQGADTIMESIFSPRQLVPAVARGTKSVLVHKKSAASANPGDVLHQLFNRELDWVDFTTLDHGLIGHSIPYGLIASLSQTGTPGPGLSFEPVPLGMPDLKDKVLSQFFGNKKQINPVGACRKVVQARRIIGGGQDAAGGAAGSSNK